MNQVFLLSSIFSFLLGASALAADVPVCVNGASEKNIKLMESFQANKDTLKVAYLAEKKQFAEVSKSAAACVESNLDINPLKSAQDIKKAAKKQAAKKQLPAGDDDDAFATKEFDDQGKSKNQLPALIRRDCIAASMKRNPGQKGYTCSTDKKTGDQDIEKTYGQVGGKTQQCITDDMVNYVQFAVNRAIKCLSPEPKKDVPADEQPLPVDARVIYQKFNNETGFNYSIAWNGGVGIGQLTTPAVKELASDVGQGQHILEAVAKSNKMSCVGFKEIAESDLKNRPRINDGNYCDFVSSGDGLARNLMYGIGYYLQMRDGIIVPTLKKRAPQLAKNREVVSALTAVSYGAEGIKKAKALIYRADASSNPKTYLASIQKSSAYLTAIKGKMREMYCLKDNVDPSTDDCKNKKLTDKQLGADQCVIQP
ncbi:MAG: hypothetical protein J7501_05290 [Bdellovibrio sp.]|nr:hypothetical protein [Bdellovibrio sp.]